jgi:hypothetical protein
MQFSTYDQDNDLAPVSCAEVVEGGWWFNYCHYVVLNGPWSPGFWMCPWCPAVTLGDDIKETKMMIKPH